ncbi:MAG: Spy/CpxP family protein refolding chaperone [Oricola sp.]
MKMRKPIISLLAAGSVVALLAMPSAAQDQRGWGIGQMMQGWGWGNGPMMGFGPDARVDRIDGRLAFLKTELKITDAQSAAWDEMAETIKTTAEAHNGLMQSMMEQMGDDDYDKMPLPERLDLRESHMGAQLEQLKELKAAVGKLYAVLDDEQKRAADEIVLPTMGMGPMGGGFGGYGMGPGMMFRQ